MQQVEVLCGERASEGENSGEDRSEVEENGEIHCLADCSIYSPLSLLLLALTTNADELELQLVKEKPRNHFDMRNRLNSKGKREGKVIDYRVTELRAVELLDGLCERMLDYTLEKVDSTKRSWVMVDDFDNLTNKQEAMAHAKDISTYCGRLLEETEDELTELIKKGSLQVGQVKKALFQTLSNHCGQEKGSLLEREEGS